MAALIALGLAAATPGCASEAGPSRPQASTPQAHRAASSDGTVSLVLEGDFLVHPFVGAVAATAIDGLVRVHVERMQPERLIRLAGAGKDAFAAHGWEVSQEQHFEQAIRVELTRGGLPKTPAEKRDVWWVSRPTGTYLCDAIARSGAFDALGEVHKSRCLSVELAPLPAASPADVGP